MANPLIDWCLGPELNRHGGGPPRDFKSLASTNSATQAFLVTGYWLLGTGCWLVLLDNQKQKYRFQIILSTLKYRRCQANLEMSYSYQDRNVLFFKSEILRIFPYDNGGS